ncbi:hypothetical protein [Nicoliella lavandulae]|uniref:Uncharacterized protein n=1 Tax=Nicoliella lavandulae TaxID=3082954 RepID=A0ABU8SLW1_9LACO
MKMNLKKNKWAVIAITAATMSIAYTWTMNNNFHASADYISTNNYDNSSNNSSMNQSAPASNNPAASQQYTQQNNLQNSKRKLIQKKNKRQPKRPMGNFAKIYQQMNHFNKKR